ncbi:hypothetical protein GS982_18320 [Rhodococcus hoagii]|nr:hypothetical protein [Prescottella equi]
MPGAVVRGRAEITARGRGHPRGTPPFPRGSRKQATKFEEMRDRALARDAARAEKAS